MSHATNACRLNWASCSTVLGRVDTFDEALLLIIQRGEGGGGRGEGQAYKKGQESPLLAVDIAFPLSPILFYTPSHTSHV